VAAKWARARKERLRPDTRPRWDDPDLKPFERVMFSDGIEREAFIPADLHKQFAEDRMDKDKAIGAHWTTDPTYDMKKGKSPFFRR
jgi:hypothetical protein